MGVQRWASLRPFELRDLGGYQGRSQVSGAAREQVTAPFTLSCEPGVPWREPEPNAGSGSRRRAASEGDGGVPDQALLPVVAHLPALAMRGEMLNGRSDGLEYVS